MSDLFSFAFWPSDLPGAVLRLLLFILPAYVANAAPVVLGGQWPMDGGARAWDGRPWLGASKTWLGLAGGFSCGLLTAILLGHLLRFTSYDLWAGQAEWYILSGALLAAGAMAGDLAGSFIKRRLGAPPGASSELLDQLTFLAGALLAVAPLGAAFAFAPFSLLFLMVVTYLVHRAANTLAHGLKLKKVPW